MIPVIIKPYKDELLYSWISRMAELNCLPLCDFMNAYMNTNYHEADILYDIRDGFEVLYYNLDAEISMTQLYMETSVFPYESIVMTEGKKLRCINRTFYSKDALNPPVSSLISEIRICPDCLDEGRFLNRAHQLSEVCHCYKHGTLLKRYIGNKENLMKLDLSDFEDVEEFDDKPQFAYELLNANLNVEFDELRKAIKLSRFSKTGDYINDIYELCGGDIEAFKKQFHKDKQPFEDEEYIFNEDYINKKCGTRFYSVGFDKGWKCPRCMEPDLGKRFKQLCSYIEGYEPLSEFKSLNEKVMFHHGVCGQECSIKGRSFLFEGVRCSCESILTEEQARNRMPDGFKLLKFRTIDTKATIQAIECGHVFDFIYRKFLKSPRCKVCFPKEMTTDALAKQLADRNFELLSEFKGQNEKVQVRCNGCGYVYECYPRHIPAECTRDCKSWMDMFNLLKEYKAETGNVNIPKRVKYKGVLLGSWCQHQRNSCTDIQKKKLLSIGFSFDPLEDEWNRRYEQYKRYVTETGSSYIAKRSDYEGEYLGVWVQTQKHRFKQGKLSDKRKQLLESLNPDIFKQS